MTRAVRRNVIAQCVGCWTSGAEIRWTVDHGGRVAAAHPDGEMFDISSVRFVGAGLAFDAVMPSTGMHTAHRIWRRSKNLLLHRYCWSMNLEEVGGEIVDDAFGIRWKMLDGVPVAGVDTDDDEDVQVDRVMPRKGGCYFESWTESTRMALKHWMNHTADGTDYRAYHVERLWRC